MDGEPFRARVGASLLRSLEMDELVARNTDGYVALAVRLATDDDFRNKIRGEIIGKMLSLPKFLDGKWYGQQIGAAFERMWNESGQGR
jgi:predicted O-linked N-acetylglucosamine transferase (SPINDLY family)